MKTKITQAVPAISALLIIGFGYLSQWCAGTGNFCYRTVVDQMIPDVTYPLYFFALYFLPIATVLIFIPRAIFKAWLKFALWALPLAVFFIWTTRVVDPTLISFTRDDAARTAAEAITLISLLILIPRLLLARRYQGGESDYRVHLQSWSALIAGTIGFASMLLLAANILVPLSTDLNLFSWLLFTAIASSVYAVWQTGAFLIETGYCFNRESRSASWRMRVSCMLLIGIVTIIACLAAIVAWRS
ncbi:MAG: hypothetical protein PHV99_03125 [Candidatus Pacebacteria bacterium]|nr:hypothetical protein [Candidatus Paceibacterota bacterium]